MKSATPKHLHPLLGRRMVDWVSRPRVGREWSGSSSLPRRLRASSMRAWTSAVQEEPRGTGDAVRCAREALADFDGDVLVLNGDVPGAAAGNDRCARRDASRRRRSGDGSLLRAGRHRRLRADRARRQRGLARIVEARDASPEELALGEVNSGIYVFSAAKLWPALERLRRTTRRASSMSPTRSRFSPSTARRARCSSRRIRSRSTASTRAPSSRAVTARLRDRINTEHMLAGVTIVDPASTWIDVTVEIEPDVTIHPFTVIRGEVRIASGVEIGPFASIRTRTDLGAGHEGRHVRRAQGGDASARGRRSHTSRTSATRRSARTRTSPQATSPRTSAISRASRRSAP